MAFPSLKVVGIIVVGCVVFTASLGLTQEIPSPPTPPQPMYKSEKIVVAMRAEFSDYKSLVPLMQKFEKETGIRIEHIDYPAVALRDNLITVLATGAPTYDVVLMDIVFIPEFAAAGFIIPLDGSKDPFIAYTKDDLADYFPGCIDAVTYKGHLYAKDYSSDIGMLYYRKDLLSDAGLGGPPTTWDELISYAKKLTKDFNGDGVTDQWGYAFTAKEYEGCLCIFNELVAQAGGFLIDKQGNVTVNEPPAVKALQFMVDLRNKYKVVPPGVVNYTEKDIHTGFINGKFAMARNWPYMWGMCEAPDSPIRGKVGMSELPRLKQGGSTMGGWFFGIAAGSKRKRAAWELIKYLTSREASVYMCYKSADIPYRRSFFEDPRVKRDLSWVLPFKDGMKDAVPRPSIPEWGTIKKPLWTEIAKALIGQKTPKQALNDVAEEWKRILSK
ncbi:ABC transporter substrate-binding protein [Candidatus Aerophobetes bacterium]|nr:ABC transporter substrate-binding protein [Candidatus Aerophobetes bacterium]